ncbi:trans-acting enoyl reductase family protein [Blastomonas sp.]|uniref:saccharopine dehydrogenase family protein n=1 Tax=Blastomonas sp. TaxID=1909299 RepID=UPI00261550F2|nr:saccharopine dehydrogenase NADP-binding domain-containing protein [Blastomonas sp.]MDM7955301.1 saccharopine dehydrogenase NADP-binding domain-containing protein [Blastomonas sp.]
MSPRENREFDVIVYGASGFTGRLVAEYLQTTYGQGGDAPKWAVAARSAEKMTSVLAEMGLPADTPVIVADADAPETIEAMAKRTKVVLTTVGPYQLYGEPLIAACAANGTDYVDLCGEPAWMRQMIDKYDAAAKASGARIVFSTGFDSIPFDLGVLMLQKECQTRFGKPAPRIKGRVRAMQGTFSGGTAASLKATMAAAAKDPAVLGYLVNPFSLANGFEGPAQPKGNKPEHDEALGSWAAPFIMAPINTKNVHRTNALLGHAYGADFVYDEMMLTGPGDKGEAIAKHLANTDMMGGEGGPKPGEGPSKEERENGFYDVLFIAEMPDGATQKYGVKGDKDPGYGSTSKMIAESALCLVQDVPEGDGGIVTPGAVLGEHLVKRLEAKAGLSFAAE